MSIKTLTNLFDQLRTFPHFYNSLEVRWHAGEPLLLPISFYEQAIEIIDNKLPKFLAIKHSVQTNALPITKDWCQFFKRNNVRVGVSIDGPAFVHDLNRVTKSNRSTFEQVLTKINLLQNQGVSYEIIAVLTNEALEFPDEIFSFFESLSPMQVGFNVEETEGIHQSRLFSHNNFLSRYERFMRRIFTLQRESALKIREFEDIISQIVSGKSSRGNKMAMPFSILSMDWAGNLSTFSPELLNYPQYHFGNVHTGDVNIMLYNPKLHDTYNIILEGIQNCSTTCPYFGVCGGGSPSNKLWENRSFASTTTFYCMARFQIITKIILEAMKK